MAEAQPPAPPAAPPGVSPPAVSPPAEKVREVLSFGGNTSAYFRIWIVNVFLTLLTLGFYSPWAKVRRLKYLHRNTHLAGGSFDYHANPVAILKGRLIAFALLLGSTLLYRFDPFLGVVFAVVFLLIYPWMLVRSRMFNLHNTSYRNLRFGFAPVYGEAYRIIIGGALLSLLTLGLALPAVRYWRARMQVNHSRFGSLGMRLHESVTGGRFYGIYFKAALAIFAGSFVIGFFVGFFVAYAAVVSGRDPSPPSALIQLLSAPVYLAVFLVLNDAIDRLVIGGIRAGGHSLHCGWRLPRLLWLRLSNLAAILLSLGLLIPWATIRLRRYQVANLAATLDGGLEEVIAVQQEDVSALGDEIGDAFDYDFGF